MGRRLEIAIVKGGKTIANAYFHCDNKTKDAIRLTSLALNGFTDERRNDLQMAVHMLGATGAGFDQTEFERIDRYKPEGYESVWLPVAESKEKGYIFITEPGMQAAHYWAESVVAIDIESKRINFGTVELYSPMEYARDFGKKAIEKLNETAITNFVDISQIPFALWKIFRKAVNNNPIGVIVDDGYKKTICRWIF